MRNPIKLNFGNEEDRLLRAIQNDDLIVFYGAGVSMLAGCKSWNELATNIVIGIPTDIISNGQRKELLKWCKTNPEKAITICYNKLKDDKCLLEKYYYNSIINSVTPQDNDKFIRIHNRIFDLNPLAFVTTNIDRGIERVSDKIKLRQKEIIDLTNFSTTDSTKIKLKTNDVVSKIRNGNIFYLHGQVDDHPHELIKIKRTIFSSNNYMSFYDDPVIKNFLKEIFSTNFTILFVGYGLGDRDILYNIHRATSGATSSEIKYYSLFANDNSSKFQAEREYLKSFSIRLLSYTVRNKNWDKLFEVLEYFTKIILQNRV